MAIRKIVKRKSTMKYLIIAAIIGLIVWKKDWLKQKWQEFRAKKP